MNKCWDDSFLTLLIIQDPAKRPTFEVLVNVFNGSKEQVEAKSYR